jgi:hypothetical protein
MSQDLLPGHLSKYRFQNLSCINVFVNTSVPSHLNNDEMVMAQTSFRFPASYVLNGLSRCSNIFTGNADQATMAEMNNIKRALIYYSGTRPTELALHRLKNPLIWTVKNESNVDLDQIFVFCPRAGRPKSPTLHKLGFCLQDNCKLVQSKELCPSPLRSGQLMIMVDRTVPPMSFAPHMFGKPSGVTINMFFLHAWHFGFTPQVQSTWT